MTIQGLDFALSSQSIWGTGPAEDVNFSYSLEKSFGPYNVSLPAWLSDVGVSASGTVSGDAGLIASLTGSTGSFSLDYPLDVQFSLPASATPGGVVDITPHLASVGDVTLSTMSPSLTADLSAFVDVETNATLSGFGTSYAFNPAPLNVREPIIAIDPSNSWSVPPDGPITFSLTDPGPFNSAPSTTGYQVLPTVSALGHAKFASGTLDLVSLISGIPGLSGDATLGPLSIDYSLLSADLTGSLDFAQQATFTPSDLEVTLTPSFPGAAQTKPIDSEFSFDVPAGWTSPVSFTTAYRLDGEVTNSLGVQGNLSLGVSALAASATLYGVTLPGSGALVPETDVPIYTGGYIPLYTLDPIPEPISQTGQSITIPVDLAQNPSPVVPPGPSGGGPTPKPVVTGNSSVSYSIGQEIALSTLFSATEQPAGSGQSPVAYDLLLPTPGGGEFVIDGQFRSGDAINLTGAEIASGYFWTGNTAGTSQIDVIAIDGAGTPSNQLGITINVTSSPPAPTPTPSGVGPLIDNSSTEPVVSVGGSAVLTGQDLYALEQGAPTTFSQMVYYVSTLPAHGTLERAGVAATTFTQADINSGLVSYVENGDPASGDSFQYFVDYAGGAASAPTTYDLSILPTATVSATPLPVLLNDNPLAVGLGQTVALSDHNLAGR